MTFQNFVFKTYSRRVFAIKNSRDRFDLNESVPSNLVSAEKKIEMTTIEIVNDRARTASPARSSDRAARDALFASLTSKLDAWMEIARGERANGIGEPIREATRDQNSR